MMTGEKTKKRIEDRVKKTDFIIGVAVGSGIMSKSVVKGGADFLILLTSSIFREMGMSSLSGYFPFGNSNEMVMNFGTKEILSRILDTPAIFGLCANPGGG